MVDLERIAVPSPRAAVPAAVPVAHQRQPPAKLPAPAMQIAVVVSPPGLSRDAGCRHQILTDRCRAICRARWARFSARALAGGAVFFFFFSLIEKSNLARAQDHSAGDSAVRRILTRSIAVRCASRFPRQGYALSCAGLLTRAMSSG